MAEADLTHSNITRLIIGAAMEVHCTLGQGFLEKVYEEALAYEFDVTNVKYERQKPIDIYYKNKNVRVPLFAIGCDAVRFYGALTGLKRVCLAPFPRAMPWAVLFCPFRAIEG